MAKVKETSPLRPRKIIPLVIAIANQMIKELRFVELINERVKWDKNHSGMSPGNLLKALVLSTFTDVRIPLVHLIERLQPLDLSYLIGTEAEYNSINSFNVGRALEKTGESDSEGIFETLALSAFQQYNIPITRVHSDTSTISFHGEYDISGLKLTDAEKEELLIIEKGYNKDGRAGDHQMVLGQIVTEHGIPVANRPLNGSTSDIEWNKEALTYWDHINVSTV